MPAVSEAAGILSYPTKGDAMNKKRMLATAMSALMIVSSTPTSALAEELGQPSDAAQAVAAGLNPDAKGGDELEKAAQAEKPAATEQKADTPAAKAAQTEAADAKKAADEKAAAKQDEKAASDEKATADEAAAEKGDDAATTEAAPAAEQDAAKAEEAATPAAAAAEAPAFKLSDHLYDSGTLSYKFVDENGNVVNSDSVALFKVTDGGITASDPVEQDGRWVATLKIDASKVDPASFAPSWAVSDPQDYELDASQSKLTVEYKTDSTEPTATSYYAAGSDRGSLVFVKKAAKPAAPKFDIDKVGETGKNVEVHVEGSDVHTTVPLDSADVASVTEPEEVDGAWQVTVTLKTPFADPNHYWLPSQWGDPNDYVVDEGNANNKLTMTFRTTDLDSDNYFAKWPNTAVVYFKKAAEQAPAVPTAEELSALQAVTFGGKAQGIFGAYPIEGTYKAAGAPTKDDKTGEWTYELELTNDAETASKYLEQKQADPATYVYDASKSNTKIKLAYDTEAKSWKVASSATLVFGYNVPSVEADNLDLSVDGVRLVDEDSDDSIATAPLANGTYALDASQAFPNGGGEWLLYTRLSNLQAYVDAYNDAHPDTYYVLAESDPNAVVVLRSYGQKWSVSEPTSVYVKRGEKPASKAAIELNATSATVSEYGLTKLGDLGVNTWVKKVTLADGTVVSADDYWKTTNPVIKDASGAEHTLADGLKPGEYTITYTLDDGSATATLKLTVTESTYDLEAKAEDNLSLADAKKLASNKAFIDKYVTKAQTGDGEDFKGDVTVSVYKGSVDPNNHLSTSQFAKQVEDGGTYIVVFEYDPDATEPYLATAQTTLTIGTPAEQAPAFDAQQKLNTAGIVELEAVDEDGNKLAEDTTGKSVNMLYDFPADISQYVTVTEPEQQADGTWKVVATLDTTKLPANVVTYLDSSFDPSQFELDTTASKVTVEFQTGTGKFDKNFYSSTGNLGQHAKLVFKKKAAERTQVMLHVHGADANDQGIEDLYPGLSGQKLSEVKGFEESLTADGYTFEGWYTQPDGQGEKVTGDTVLPEGASQFNIYAYWKVADTYTLSVPAEQTVTPEVAQGLRFADFSEYVKALGATGTRNGQPVDPTDDFWNVHVTDVNGNGTADFGEGKEGTYKVTFTLGDQTAVSLVTVKAAPAAPAFNLDAVANYAGNVTVRTVDADGSQLAEDTTGYSLSRLFGFPGDISQYAKASEPEQQADGTWKVTVTFDASKLDPADVLVSEAQWGDASQYEFDAADSQQTITFQTDPGSTQYYAKGSATVTYKKQAEPSVPAKPTDDQVKAALNNLVKVNDGTTEKAYGLIDGTFTVADPVKGASGTYTTVVTVKGSEAQKYVDLYNKDVSGSFVPSDTSDLLYYLTYDAKTGTWAGAAEQTFYVKASAYVVTIDLGYDADGDGANEVQILRVPVNGEVKFTFPTREGYTFVGLAFDPAGTKPFDFEKDYITGDITLYAQWKKNDDNGGQGGTNTPTTPQGDDKGDDTDGSKDQKLKGGSNEEGGKALPQTGDTDARGIAAALTVAGGMFAALGAWISRRDWKDAWKRNGR